MREPADRFWTDYSALVARLLDPLGPEDGVPETEVVAAERRLGFRLPGLLREFYLRVGQRDDINGCQEFLVSPGDLRWAGKNVLLFYEENQGACFWGLDLSDPESADPPVLRADRDDTLVWQRAHEHLSEFLVAMLFWQAVNGGMDFYGIGKAVRKNVEHAPSDWERKDLGGDWQAHVFLREGQILLCSPNDSAPLDPEIDVQGGGRTEDDFAAVEAVFSVRWDYTESPDDNAPEDPAEVARRRQEQIEKAQTPWGDAICDGCGAPKRTWADTAKGVCGRCGYPLGPEPASAP